jgi:predicted dehydrogenase
MTQRSSRRQFLENAGTIGAGFWIAGCQRGYGQEKSPNAKVNVAVIGAGGKGGGEIQGIIKNGDNIVAFCDIDDKAIDGAMKHAPDAKRYNDYRQLFDKELKNFDAVTVSTPDHHHFPATMLAIKNKKHAYTQKPLVHSVWEARTIAEAAKANQVVTQMGNQGHASDPRREQVEKLRSGILGKVSEVHCWTNRPIWPQAIDRPKKEDPVPAHIHWDEWIGPAPMRPYVDKVYHSFKWRGWWDFGTGALGDMACHIMDTPFWGLGLGYPTSVKAEGEPLHPESGPKWMIVELEFPARGEQPPLKFFWYDGQKLPPEDLACGIKLKTMENDKEKILVPNGYIIKGDKGSLVATDEQGQGYKLFPEDLRSVKVDKSIPRTGGGHEWGNHKEWLQAIKGEGKTQCGFDYAGPFTESVLIGIAAFRAGKKLDWDGKNMKATNCPEAAQYIKREYRKGWDVV